MTQNTSRPPSPQIVEGLTAGFLIASPTLSDPSFAQTLLLVAQHDEDGAQGFIVNRESSLKIEAILKGLFDVRGPEKLHERRDELVGWGGPVEESSLWVLYARSPGEALEDDAITLGPEIALGNSQHLLERFTDDDHSGEVMLVLGYAGWGPGQLERELKEGAWLPLEFDRELVFDVPLEHRWEIALQRLGLSAGAFIMGRSGEMD